MEYSKVKLPIIISEYKFHIFKQSLIENNWNQNLAADAIGISHRTGREWIKKLRKKGFMSGRHQTKDNRIDGRIDEGTEDGKGNSIPLSEEGGHSL